MSEENPVKITNVTKTKDPRRVEAGKRLAAISKDAKKRKADATSASEIPDTLSSMDLKEIGLMVSVVGILVGVAGLYYKFGKKSECENVIVANTCPDEEQESEAKRSVTKTTYVEDPPKSVVKRSEVKLDSLD